jgi:hypothetical protein
MTASVTRIPAPWETDLPPGHVGKAEFLDRTGITYRCLDYWTRTKLLQSPETRGGSGYPRTWPATEIPVAILINRLSKAGIDIRIAEPAARALLSVGHAYIAGIRIELPEEA